MQRHHTRDEVRTERFISQSGDYVVEAPVARPDDQPAPGAPDPAEGERYDDLCGVWSDAIDQLRRQPGPWSVAAEQATYERLVDLVEDNGWAGTALDPRGAQSPADEALSA